MESSVINIVIVDDHVLILNGLRTLINTFDNCKVMYEAVNGKALQSKLPDHQLPDVILLDLNMPEMDGYATAAWLQKHYPEIPVLMLTMYDSELTLIRLLNVGVRGFLKKDIDPSEFKHALQTVVQSGYYYSSSAAGRLANLFRHEARNNHKLQNSMLSDLEVRFLQLACSDRTYKEVAQQMHLSPRAVDTLRDQLFVKFDVKSRVGLAIIAIRDGIMHLG